MSERNGLPSSHSVQPEDASRSSSTVTLLVVEDEPDLLTLMEHNLVRSGFQVVTAGSVAAAEKELASRIPDLIILDIMLPDGSGLKLCREICQAGHASQVPIVLVTASLLPSDREEGLAAGASDYITKPFAIGQLIETVNKQLNHPGRSPNNWQDSSHLATLRKLRSTNE